MNAPLAQYGKDMSLNCVLCKGHFRLCLFVVTYITVLIAKVVLFIQGARKYAQETLAGGGVLQLRAITSLRFQPPASIGIHDASQSIRPLENPFNEQNVVDPADILKVFTAFLLINTYNNVKFHELSLV